MNLDNAIIDLMKKVSRIEKFRIILDRVLNNGFNLKLLVRKRIRKSLNDISNKQEKEIGEKNFEEINTFEEEITKFLIINEK